MKNKYTFPRIDDSFDQLRSAQIFSKIDLIFGCQYLSNELSCALNEDHMKNL
jgi:hypothetical protein